MIRSAPLSYLYRKWEADHLKLKTENREENLALLSLKVRKSPTSSFKVHQLTFFCD